MFFSGCFGSGSTLTYLTCRVATHPDKQETTRHSRTLGPSCGMNKCRLQLAHSPTQPSHSHTHSRTILPTRPPAYNRLVHSLLASPIHTSSPRLIELLKQPVSDGIRRVAVVVAVIIVAAVRNRTTSTCSSRTRLPRRRAVRGGAQG